jgi:hypothetical protein
MDRVIAKPAFLKMKGTGTNVKYVNLANLKDVDVTTNSITFNFQQGPSTAVTGLSAAEVADMVKIIEDCSIFNVTAITKGRS